MPRTRNEKLGPSIQTNLTNLCSYTSVNTELLVFLYEKDLISESLKDTIENEPANLKKALMLYNHLMKRPDNDFENILKSLEYSGNKSALQTFRQLTNSKEIPIWYVGPMIRNFVGRKKELADLQELIVSNKLIHLNGMGGIGKTELAKAFAKLFFSQYNASCIWLNGEDDKSLRQSVDNFEHSLETEKSGRIKTIQPNCLYEILKEAINPFLAHSSYVLFIVDNVDEPHEDVIDLLKELQSIDKVRALVTSRNKGVLKFAGVTIHLNELKIEDAQQFFEASLRTVGTSEDIKKLCNQLHNYPLALGQASAYIKEQRIISMQGKGYSVADYLKEYAKEENKSKLLDYQLNKIEYDYPLTTLTALNISINKFYLYGTIGNQAINTLKVLAYLQPNDMKYDFIQTIFHNVFPGFDENIFDEALKLIKLYSLIKVDYLVVSMHSLVQEIVRLNVGNEEETLLRNLIRTYLKIREPIHIQLWKYASKYDELFEDFSAVPFQILDRLFFSIFKAHFYSKDALTFATENHLRMVKVFGEYGEDTLKMKLHIGKIFTNLRRYDEALKYFEDVHAFSKHYYGQQSRLALESMGEMAWTLSLLGRKKASLKWFKKLMPSLETVFEICDPIILYNKLNMGQVLYHLGEYSEAIGTFEYALLFMNESLKEGSDFTQIFKTKELLGRCFHLQGDFSLAKETFIDITRQLHLCECNQLNETKRLLALSIVSMEQLEVSKKQLDGNSIKM